MAGVDDQLQGAADQQGRQWTILAGIDLQDGGAAGGTRKGRHHAGQKVFMYRRI